MFNVLTINKMKELLILFTLFLGLGTVNAQAKKAVAKSAVTKEQPTGTVKEESSTQAKGPTKEETIAYIKNELNTGSAIYYVVYPESGRNGVLNPKRIVKIFIKGISFDNCELIFNIETKISERYSDIRWREYEQDFQKDVTIKIPLNKIESIEKRTITDEKAGVDTDFIEFKVSKGENLIYHSRENLTFSKYSLDINAFNVDKLTKAFNHLRKLCGAPEPISFD